MYIHDTLIFKFYKYFIKIIVIFYKLKAQQLDQRGLFNS